MLEDLVQTIETLKARIKEHGPYIGAYESRTRVTLIDPMLCALGWDVSDPYMVQIEPRTVNGWADYALLGSNRKPVVFVEAKKLTDKDAPIRQTVGYAVSENIENRTNVRYCASTNGDDWEVYDIIAQESVMKISISTEDSAICTLKFLGLWRRSLADSGFNPAVEPLIAVEQLPIAPQVEPEPRISTPPQGVEQPPSVTTFLLPLGAEWVPLCDGVMRHLESKGHTTNSETRRLAPTAMRFSDGQEVLINAWKYVQVRTAEWLVEKGLVTLENCEITDASRPNLNILSPRGKHANGKDFRYGGDPIGDTGIKMNVDLSAKHLILNACKLIEHFGRGSSQVHLKLP